MELKTFRLNNPKNFIVGPLNFKIIPAQLIATLILPTNEQTALWN